MRPYDEAGSRGGHQVESTTARTRGNVWYVDSDSGSAGNNTTSTTGTSWDTPFATVNYAISRCSNDSGAVIYVAPSHTESIADTSPLNESGTVTDEFCVDKSGVSIIGVGSGTNRPTFTFGGATDATLEVRKANVTLKNLILVSNLADVAALITVQSTGDGLLVENCEFRDSGATLEHVLAISLAAAADDVTIRGCRFYNTLTATACTAAIMSVGATTRLEVYDNYFRGDWSTAVMDLNAAASYDSFIVDNIIHNQAADAGVAAIECHSGTTGVITGNVIHCGLGVTPIIAAACMIGRNWFTAAEGNPAQELAMQAGSGGTTLHGVYYVDSGTGSDSNDGRTWGSAVATIQVAIDLCTADNGDVIYVAAGFADNIDGTVAFDVDCNGISIIGLGEGANRPTFTMITSTADANCDMSANNCLLENLRFLANINDGDKLMLVTGTECTVRSCYFGEGGQVPDTCITVGAADGDANDLVIEDCVFDVPTADSNTAAIDIVKDMDGIIIRNNIIRTDSDDGCIDIDAGGDACTNLTIQGNTITQLQTGDHCIQISGVTVTGIIRDNLFINDTLDQVVDPAICQLSNNTWSALGTAMVARPFTDGDRPGIDFYVDSGATGAATTAGHGYSWQNPLSTIDAAVALCVDNRGDVIHLAPGHSETLAAAQITLDKHGITLEGHGSGTLRPSIVYTNALSSLDISSDNITVRNIQFIPSVTVTAIAVDIMAGATNTLIENCAMVIGQAANGTDDFVECIDIKAGCHDTVIRNCDFFGHASNNGNDSAIKLTGASNRVIIDSNLFRGPWQTACIEGDTTLSLDLIIRDNIFMQIAAKMVIDMLTGTTGIIYNNMCNCDVATVPAAIDCDGAFLFRNEYNEDAGSAATGCVWADSATVTASADD